MLRRLLPPGRPPRGSGQDGAGQGVATAEQTRSRPRSGAEWVWDKVLAARPRMLLLELCGSSAWVPDGSRPASRRPEHLPRERRDLSSEAQTCA